MVDMLDTHGAGLILDLRLNNGGEVGLNSWILQAVRRSKSIERGAPFYILIGPRTFSAGMNLSVDLDWHTRAIFVGEPTGSSLVHFGQDNFTQLANSGLRVSAASRRFQGVASDDQRKWIAPDIYIPITFSDFENHDDPVLREIVDYTTAHISP